MGHHHDGSFLDIGDSGEGEQALREQVHRIAWEVLRPAAWALDRMAPADRVAPDSPFFSTMATLKGLGYHRLFLPPEAGGPPERLSALAQSVVLEELGWGSLGLATAFLVDMLPVLCISNFGCDELKAELMVPWVDDETGAFHGCWAITEPDHGSDFLGMRDTEASTYGRAQLVAELTDGGWLLSGQKSAWVSSGPIATHAAVHAQAGRDGDLVHGLFAVVDLGVHGVRRGPPADMMGVRDDPQGELFFDEVFVPDRNVLVPPGPLYPAFGDQLLCLTSSVISNVAVGVARAAFEEALHHARTRVQGGGPLARHKNIQLTLYAMFERVETSRAYARAALAHTQANLPGARPEALGASPRHARAAQVFTKRTAYEVAHDALQVFGAQGLSRDSLVEKLFRDARSLLIEDGTLEVLALDAARDLIDNYECRSYDLEERMATWTSTPMDAPLFTMDPERGIEYWGCKAVMATFTVGGSVADLVPRGLHLDAPAFAAVLIADYGASTLGPYREYVSLLRVVDDEGVAGMYIPYIYVTNDAALTAGREVLGAPKKLASINVDVSAEAVVGTLARPAACPLVQVVMTPAGRLGGDVFDALLPSGTPFFSLRHLPGPPGATQVHELIRWNCDLAVRADAFGDLLRFTGPSSVTYPTRSAVDPVQRLEVDTVLGGAYLEFDMRLTAGGVVWSETVAAEATRSSDPAEALT